MDRLLRAEEISRMLGVTKGTVYRLVAEEFIPFIKIGGCVRFREEDVRNWLEKRERPKRGPQRIYID